jgi:hypothetical protein
MAGGDERETTRRTSSRVTPFERLGRWLAHSSGWGRLLPNGYAVLFLIAVTMIVTGASVIRGELDDALLATALAALVFWFLVGLCLPRTPTSRRGLRGLGLALAAGAFLIALALLPRINALLTALFTEGDSSYGMSQGLLSFSGMSGGPDGAQRAVDTWQRFSSLEPNTTPGGVVAMWWLLVDTVLLVPAYGLLAMWWLLDKTGPLRTRFESKRSEVRELEAVVRWVRRAVVALVVVDLLENTAMAGTVLAGWEHWGIQPLAAQAARVLAASKWFFVAIAAAPTVLVLLPKMRELRPDRPLGHGLVMSRFQMLAVGAMVIFGLFFPDQLEDVIVDASLARMMWIVIAAFGLGQLMAVTSRGLIEVDRFRSRVEFTAAHRRWIIIGSVSLVAAFVLMGLVFGIVPWGVVVAVAIVALSSLASWRIGRSARRDVREGAPTDIDVVGLVSNRAPDGRPDRPSLRVPGLAAGVPLLLIGFWTAQATTELAVYEPHRIAEELVMKLLLGGLIIVAGCLVMLRHWHRADRLWHGAQMVGTIVSPPDWVMRPHLRHVANTVIQRVWWDDRRRSRVVSTFLGYVVALLVGLYAWTSPVARADDLGVIVILVVSLAVLSGLGTLLLLLADWISDLFSPPGKTLPPELFRIAGLIRIPVLTLLVVWLAANQMLFGNDDHFDIRTVEYDSGSDVERLLSMDTAFETWAANHPALACEADEGSIPAVPLIVVSSEGGGIRAGYWAASVLDELFSGTEVSFDTEGCSPTPAWSHVFALSGVSGGSVGMAAYLQQRSSDPSQRPTPWEAQRLGGDNEFLSAPISWLLVPEIVGWHYLRLPISSRIEYQEQSLEAAWGFEPADPPPEDLLRVLADTGEAIGPAVIFNAATSGEGCILNVGPLRVSTSDPGLGCLTLGEAPPDLAGGLDAGALICDDDDMTIFTAAMASARFPVVSPAAHYQCDRWAPLLRARVRNSLARTIDGDAPPTGIRSGPPEATAIDGGAVDAGGALTPGLLWPDVLRAITEWNEEASGACIVPLHIHLDNGGEKPAQAREPFSGGQLAAFNGARAAGNTSRSERARIALADLFSEPYGFTRDGRSFEAGLPGPADNAYVRVFPRSAPAVRAPLGWFLSDVATNLMDDQLEELQGDDGVLTGVLDWFAAPRTCRPPE